MVRVRIKSVKPGVSVNAVARALRAAGFVPQRFRDERCSRIGWERIW